MTEIALRIFLCDCRDARESNLGVSRHDLAVAFSGKRWWLLATLLAVEKMAASFRNPERRFDSRKDDGDLPELHSVVRGEVVRIENYGAFVKLEGCRRNGLIHISQISNSRVEDVSDVLEKGEYAYCKVTGVKDEEGQTKIALSMKYVNQQTGEDADPNNVKLNADERGRKHFDPRGKKKIELGAIFNTTCKQCGGEGHVAQDCFQSSGKKYDLLPEVDDFEFLNTQKSDNTVILKEARKLEKRKKSNSVSSGSSESLPSKSRKRGKHKKELKHKKKRKKEKKKHKATKH